MNLRCLILDFDDSFTYNIASELQQRQVEVTVLNWREFLHQTLFSPRDTLLILGPGPGHPLEYQSLFPAIESWIKQNAKMIGICLGLQILETIRGKVTQRCMRPIHGVQVDFELGNQNQNIIPGAWKNYRDIWPARSLVQRYHSLCIPKRVPEADELCWFWENELWMRVSRYQISYQFHPESVGTTEPGLFLWPAVDFSFGKIDSWM